MGSVDCKQSLICLLTIETVDQEYVQGVSGDWRSHEDQGKKPSAVKKKVFLSLSQSLLPFKGDRHSLVENDKLF